MLSLIEQWHESGKTQQVFCQEHDLTFSTFYYWLKRYRSGFDENSSLPVEVSSGSYIEICYPGRAENMLERMRKLYMTEREARENNLSFEHRKELRTEQSLPILQELEKWMKEQLPDVLPKSSIGQAITYTLGLLKRLNRYIENEQVEIDNNLIENSIRPVSLGTRSITLLHRNYLQCSACQKQMSRTSGKLNVSKNKILSSLMILVCSLWIICPG
jgi:hypothetical protein